VAGGGHSDNTKSAAVEISATAALHAFDLPRKRYFSRPAITVTASARVA